MKHDKKRPWKFPYIVCSWTGHRPLALDYHTELSAILNDVILITNVIMYIISQIIK